MSNGHVCCLLSVCCPAGSAEQQNAIIEEMNHDGLKLDPLNAEKVAKWLVKNFDFAPAGTLAPYRDAIVGHARKLKPEAGE